MQRVHTRMARVIERGKKKPFWNMVAGGGADLTVQPERKGDWLGSWAFLECMEFGAGKFKPREGRIMWLLPLMRRVRGPGGGVRDTTASSTRPGGPQTTPFSSSGIRTQMRGPECSGPGSRRQALCMEPLHGWLQQLARPHLPPPQEAVAVAWHWLGPCTQTLERKLRPTRTGNEVRRRGGRLSDCLQFLEGWCV